MPNYYAHTRENSPPEEWQLLDQHLKQVAERAADFAKPFAAGPWAAIAGLWHDVGKFSQAFQDYLLASSSPDAHTPHTTSRTDHSTAGAKHAVETCPILGHLLAYAITGHHSGLLDGRGDGACLEARLKKRLDPYKHGLSTLPKPPDPELPVFLQKALEERNAHPKATSFTFAFFVRMLFSCLVDADFLDTEMFIDARKAAKRPRIPDRILERMEEALSLHIASLHPDDSTVNRARSSVRQACLQAADSGPGLFSLTVPTGGGKTLSSLAFALRHANKNKLRRIVYVIPFTSIIEQNAEEFRRVMARLPQTAPPHLVLEHHCNLDTGKETETSRIASENWDAPLILTTSVQFYESLFAHRSSRCRKLHRLARAVIILDEVQTLPVDYLAPCLRSLAELASNYGATILLCTATQPAIHSRDDFLIGLEGVREIIPEPRQLYDDLKRVTISDIGQQDDEALARRLLKEKQVLCIVNTRRHARQLIDFLGPADDNIHLSALMCPAHRSQVIETIRQRLDRGLQCRVVSTQLIEAGVDIDFPIVFRSLAGLDSIAQAAGRCNRNGTLGRFGKTLVFRSQHRTSERFFRETANCASQILSLGTYDDPLDLTAIEHYFQLYYWDQASRWDKYKILEHFHLFSNDRALPFGFGFATVAKAFNFIEDRGRPVIIPWGLKGHQLCDDLRSPFRKPDRHLLRSLQRYTVKISTQLWNVHLGTSIQLVHESYPVLTCPEMHYSEHFGLCLDCEEPVFLTV